jgi:hypothetical protein
LRGIRCAASSATTSVVRVASLPHTRSGDCALLLWPLACFCSLFSAHAGPCGPRRPCPTLIQPPAAAFSTCRVPFAGAVYPVRAASARGLSVSFGRPVLFALHVSGFERRVPATGVPAEPRTSRIYEVHGARVRMQIAPIFASSTLFLTLCPRAKTLRTWRTAVAGTARRLQQHAWSKAILQRSALILRCEDRHDGWRSRCERSRERSHLVWYHSCVLWPVDQHIYPIDDPNR